MGIVNLIDARIASAAPEADIPLRARELQLRLWNQKRELCRGRSPVEPVELFDPGMALSLLGFEVITDQCLGEMNYDGRRIQVAGTIDLKGKVVRISPNLTFEELRFTTAHELGHAVLHTDMDTLHRDRSLTGPVLRRDRREVQADQYASCFLMPERWVRNRFRQCFGMDRFELTEDTAFGLGCLNIDKARLRYRSPRDLSQALARSCNFLGQSFDSLSKYFHVSPTAMAIRLNELGLV